MSQVVRTIRSLRSLLAHVDESCTPREADAIYIALVAHIRARRPDSVAPLGELAPPTELVRDPREV